MSGAAFSQVIDIEDFGTGTYPGAPLPAGQTSYIFNAPPQPATFPNILDDGEYVLATDSQQGFENWASINDNTTGTGYMMLVNADDNQSGEFYRRQVSLTANTSFEFIAYLVTVNSQGDFDFCTANEGGLVLPNVTLQIEDNTGGILASFETGDIPFNPNPEWEEYTLDFSTNATTTSVNVVLINNSLGGCGNDLAIDDITFRVAVTMEAFNDNVTVSDTTTAQNAVIDLGDNDTIDGNPLTGTELFYVATGSSLPSGITLNENTGEIDVAAGTASGTYSFVYEVCETSNQFNCDTATVEIIVTNPNGGLVCPVGTAPTPGTFHVVSATGGDNPERTVGLPLAEGSTGTDANSARTFFAPIIMDLTGSNDILVPEGELIEIVLTSRFSSNALAEILMSADGVNYTSLGTTGNGGSVYGAWTSNIFRYDDFTVPVGGARYIEMRRLEGGVRADGVIYSSQCQEASAAITASKSVSVYNPDALDIYATPGNDVIYTITVANAGPGSASANSMFLVDNMPSEISFYNDDQNGTNGPETDPIIFTESGSGLTFTYNSDVAFSNAAAPPADFSACNYTPVSSGYDDTITHICFNPKGEMLPNSNWSVSFRARIN